MKQLNIYICGVGGQGIGLLSEILLRGADYAGVEAKAVDTHGLAQRGGIVISHLRLGKNIFSPMIPEREADLVIALERHEALRGMDYALKDGGTLIYYNTVLQPLGVRLGQENELTKVQLQNACKARGISCIMVEHPDLADPRMQNIAVLSRLNLERLIPEISQEHLLRALEDLVEGKVLEKNRALLIA
ncbi:2-oxoacid:acceptor oxidoreductase family protein [Desulfopila sp. IMCC35008]|uniref:2-oxoacid:acceptor oxidoreductase family protein n=1 Tax=Desulfopila sp. IMCC35008 TaxID=2653858 RepID=UPI0013D7804F|nr:2-oxoacid:acceptor oxidoreductase family protein [Desulfopila sp. IMCC35008]